MTEAEAPTEEDTFNRPWAKEYFEIVDMIKGLKVEWKLKPRHIEIKIRGNKKVLEMMTMNVMKSGDKFDLRATNMVSRGINHTYNVEEGQKRLPEVLE